ncbi:Cupin domain-containing protein [Pantoea sp. AS-PWVM4]|uniref:Cupin domain-containing protein n=1 Tax=Pantoea phytobeneficialis TaxID=2052056 RepID=A0AAP9H5R6_9GAMM|nr:MULTISPECIES: cupin domain-containing protein [Pantoea]ERK17264.1 Cupin domain-containing protein [Pantoea sp. AS-PWVM4]MDO6409186.1 cupin domain-containing protein [Pantoea phytobeneficialis]QGR07071.1 cupin domain-containing protein [Pantoea phytobeneficialis]
MTVYPSSLLLLMSFAAGTFSAGASSNPQHLMLSIPSGGVPNNPLPLIIWPGVAPDNDSEDEENQDTAIWFEETFTRNGWPAAWRSPIFPYTHYHPNTHEIIGVGAGWAEVLFGGDSGRMVTLREGDAVLIPAGVGHKQIHASEDFFTVGAYPEGISPETLRDEPRFLRTSQAQIQRVPMPKRDPFTGGEGAMTEIWLPVAQQLLHQ